MLLINDLGMELFCRTEIFVSVMKILRQMKILYQNQKLASRYFAFRKKYYFFIEGVI